MSGWFKNASRYDLPGDDDKYSKRRRGGRGPGPVTALVAIVCLLALFYFIFIRQHTARAGDYSLYISGPGNSTARFHKFFDWLLANQFEINTDLVKLTYMGPEQGFGVTALKDMAKGEHLFCVPDSLIWTSQNKKSKPEYQEVIKFIRAKEYSDSYTLSVWLFMLDYKDPTSFWRPFIDAMPFPHCPADYNEAELAALQNELVVNTRYKNVDYVLSIFKYLLPQLTEEFPAIFGGEIKYDTADFLWAAQTLLHRAFSYEDNWALVPYLELINNQLVWDRATKTYSNINNYNIKNRRYCDDANRDYKQGEQLFDVYQMNFNTIQYLLQYGFVTEDNALDYVILRTYIPLSDPNLHEKAQLLRLESPEKPVTAVLRMSDLRIPSAFVRALVISHLNDDEFRELSAEEKEHVPPTWIRESFHWMEEAIEEFVSRLPTSLNEDQALLEANKGLSDNMQTAIRFRIAMKKQLEQIIQRIHSQPQTTDLEDSGPTDIPLATIEVKRRD